MTCFIDNPHTIFRVIRADFYPVRTSTVGAFEQVIPMIPDLQHVTVAIGDINDILPDTSSTSNHIPTHGARKTGIFFGDRIGKFGFTPLQEKDSVFVLDIDARVTAPG